MASPESENLPYFLGDPVPGVNEIDTYGKFLHLVLDHLEIIVHQILHQRGLYPDNFWAKTRTYDGRPVHQNLVPKVNEFIRDMVEQLGVQLANVGAIYTSLHF